LPQKSSFIGFGFASGCEAWLCPAVTDRRFQLGYALTLLCAEPKTNYRSHTAGQSHASNSWQIKDWCNLDFWDKVLTCSFRSVVFMFVFSIDELIVIW